MQVLKNGIKAIGLNSLDKLEKVHVTDLFETEKINATAPQPLRNVLKHFAIFMNVAHSSEPGETPSNSVAHQAPNYVQRS